MEDLFTSKCERCRHFNNGYCIELKTMTLPANGCVEFDGRACAPKNDIVTKKLEYYTVVFAYNRECVSGGNLTVKTKVIGERQRFLKFGNAVKRLESILKSRPECEGWHKTLHRDAYAHKYVEDDTFQRSKWYELYIKKCEFDCAFDDGEAVIRIVDNI